MSPYRIYVFVLWKSTNLIVFSDEGNNVGRIIGKFSDNWRVYESAKFLVCVYLVTSHSKYHTDLSTEKNLSRMIL